MKDDFDYESIIVKKVLGRFVTNEMVLDFLSDLNDSFKIEDVGQSVQGRSIKSVTIGNGPHRIFMWSQMHGNESTTTKAILDLLNYFGKGDVDVNGILKACTIKIIPILSPDGAYAYTRLNANSIDLNRDAKDLTQPESIALRTVFDAFKPHFAFNLHGQRTIYNVGTTNKPASASFLSPSVDETRKLTESRKRAMQLIVAMNKMLQTTITGGVGRYDDGFNINCVGDTFQSLDCPTILFEAGHFPGDYQREKVRKLMFISLFTAIDAIAREVIDKYDFAEYFEIPENGKQFFDILIKNIHIYNDKYAKADSIGILFEETLKDGAIEFIPKIEEVGALESYFGHKTFDCSIEQDLLHVKAKAAICSEINNI